MTRLPPTHARLALLLLAAPFTLATAQNQAAPRQVTVQVRTANEGAPLGHGVVNFPAHFLERFTGPTGSVVFPLPPGRARMIVKRLGFIPKDTVITIGDEPSQRFSIALQRLSVRIGEVRVAGWPPCTAPGLPDPARDPQGRSIVEQLQQNADRYRLLERTYPFIYWSERVLGRRAEGGEEVVEATDTTLISSEATWNYKPGTVVRRTRRGFLRGGDRFSMRIPTLRDLSDPVFIDNHCFVVQGIEEKGGQRLLRLDIVAADSISAPDVHVAAWLDTADFRLRAATYHLTRIPPELAHLKRVTNDVLYLEVIPFVPVVFSVTAESLEQDKAGARRILVERQVAVELRFLKAVPEGIDDTRRPAAPRRRP